MAAQQEFIFDVNPNIPSRQVNLLLRQLMERGIQEMCKLSDFHIHSIHVSYRREDVQMPEHATYDSTSQLWLEDITHKIEETVDSATQ